MKSVAVATAAITVSSAIILGTITVGPVAICAISVGVGTVRRTIGAAVLTATIPTGSVRRRDAAGDNLGGGLFCFGRLGGDKPFGHDAPLSG